jgi:hypothetical protein
MPQSDPREKNSRTLQKYTGARSRAMAGLHLAISNLMIADHAAINGFDFRR